jgi:3-oxoacyl-[acyl-carrier protein] reductase
MSASSRPALVTGGSGGIGGAVVRALAPACSPLVFTHLGDGARAEALAREAQEAGCDARAVECDGADADAVARLHRGFAPLVFVHCAGIARDGAIWKQEPDAFDATLSANLRSAWLHLRAAAPAMREARWGRVVLIGSINGSRGKAGQTAYAASKAGLIGLARSAAKELGGRGVTVNVVEPGWVETPMTARLPAEFRARALDESLTGRLTAPEDVSAAVAFLCSDAAAQITGQVLRVDGGQCVNS